VRALLDAVVQSEAVRATARIDMVSSADGGLAEPLPSPCQSSILHVEHDTDGDDQIDLGVRITTPGEPLMPGTARMAVQLDFWSDLADMHVVPGSRFTLRYPSRVVGRGQVLDVLQS